jgi:hypothetical protein
MGVRNCEKMLVEYLDLSNKLVISLREEDYASPELFTFENATKDMQGRLIERRQSNIYIKNTYNELMDAIEWIKKHPILTFIIFLGILIFFRTIFWITNHFLELILMGILGGNYGG